jgi:hypothetical protein
MFEAFSSARATRQANTLPTPQIAHDRHQLSVVQVVSHIMPTALMQQNPSA